MTESDKRYLQSAYNTLLDCKDGDFMSTSDLSGGNTIFAGDSIEGNSDTRIVFNGSVAARYYKEDDVILLHPIFFPPDFREAFIDIVEKDFEFDSYKKVYRRKVKEENLEVLL